MHADVRDNPCVVAQLSDILIEYSYMLNWHSKGYGTVFWNKGNRDNMSDTILCVANGTFKREVTTWYTVYPKKYAHGFCFAVLCCGYTLTDFPISFRLTSLALWQSNDCPSASKATLMNMDKCFMWIHYERLHNHNKAKHNKTVCIFLGIYCTTGVMRYGARPH